jgi:cytidylate kinase
LIIKICGTPYAGKATLGKHLANLYDMPFFDLRSIRNTLAHEKGVEGDINLRAAQYDALREVTKQSPDHFIIKDLYVEYVFNHRLGQPGADSYEILLGVEDESIVRERYEREDKEFNRLAYLHTVKACQEKNSKQEFKLTIMTDKLRPDEVVELVVQGLKQQNLHPKKKELVAGDTGERVKRSWLKR